MRRNLNKPPSGSPTDAHPVGLAPGWGVGRSGRRVRRPVLGRSARRTRPAPGVAAVRIAARLALPVAGRRLQTLPPRRRVLGHPRAARRRAGRLMATLDQLRPGERAEVTAATRDAALG